MAPAPEDARGWAPRYEDGVTNARAPNLLDLTPRRYAAWEEKDGRVVLLRPRPESKGLRALAEWLSYLLAARRLRLDELGSFCWQQIDGRRSALEIAALLRRELGDAAEPAEERVGRFLRILQREDLVRFHELESGGP